jgi:sec-independent protein translocase protein TatA
MFNIGGWEMAILLIAGLVFFGPDKLPQLMRQAGKIMREIKKASNEFQYSIEREMDEDKYARQHRRDRKRARKLAKLKAEQDTVGGGLMVGDDPVTPGTGEAPAGTVPAAAVPLTDAAAPVPPVPAASASATATATDPVAPDPSAAPEPASTKTGS